MYHRKYTSPDWFDAEGDDKPVPMVAIIAEDEIPIRTFMESIVLAHTHVERIHSFADGEGVLECVRTIYQQSPSAHIVVFLDILMPTRGDSVCKAIRAEFAQKPCIIACTGSLGTCSVETYFEAGFDSTLGKPIGSPILRSVLDHVRTQPHAEFLHF